MNDFKYLTLVEWSKEEIRNKKMVPGDRFYSENELCEIHHVSRQTVRQAMAELEDENVLTRRRGSGSFVKNISGTQKSSNFNVGVISTFFSDYIFPSIVTGIESVLRQHHIGMQMAITHNQVAEESTALKSMLNQDIRGLIVEPSKSALPNPNMDLYKQINDRGIPVVFFNAKYAWTDFPCVAMDDVAAGRIVTDHLFDLGHEKINGIMLLDDMQGQKRYEGMMQSFEEHGAMSAEQNILWYSSSEKQELFKKYPERIEDFVRNATAVVCYNDDIAVRLVELCRNCGIRIPDDLSIVGIDDSKLGRICEVPLTTVRHPHQELGKCATEKLIDMIDNPSAEMGDTLFKPELIKRASSARLQKH